MNDPTPTPPPGLPRWFAPSLALLFFLQLGLLWVQGGLLNHQRHEIRALREDILSLADLIDQGWGSGEPMEGLNPVRIHPKRRPHLVRAGIQNPEEEDKVAQELKAARQSGQEAKAKGDATQKKLDLQENYRLGQEQQRREAEQHKWGRLIGGGMALGLLLVFIRAWMRRR